MNLNPFSPYSGRSLRLSMGRFKLSSEKEIKRLKQRVHKEPENQVMSEEKLKQTKRIVNTVNSRQHFRQMRIRQKV